MRYPDTNYQKINNIKELISDGTKKLSGNKEYQNIIQIVGNLLNQFRTNYDHSRHSDAIEKNKKILQFLVYSLQKKLKEIDLSKKINRQTLEEDISSIETVVNDKLKGYDEKLKKEIISEIENVFSIFVGDSKEIDISLEQNESIQLEDIFDKIYDGDASSIKNLKENIKNEIQDNYKTVRKLFVDKIDEYRKRCEEYEKQIQKTQNVSQPKTTIKKKVISNVILNTIKKHNELKETKQNIIPQKLPTINVKKQNVDTLDDSTVKSANSLIDKIYGRLPNEIWFHRLKNKVSKVVKISVGFINKWILRPIKFVFSSMWKLAKNIVYIGGKILTHPLTIAGILATPEGPYCLGLILGFTTEYMRKKFHLDVAFDGLIDIFGMIWNNVLLPTGRILKTLAKWSFEIIKFIDKHPILTSILIGIYKYIDKLPLLGRVGFKLAKMDLSHLGQMLIGYGISLGVETFFSDIVFKSKTDKSIEFLKSTNEDYYKQDFNIDNIGNMNTFDQQRYHDLKDKMDDDMTIVEMAQDTLSKISELYLKNDSYKDYNIEDMVPGLVNSVFNSNLFGEDKEGKKKLENKTLEQQVKYLTDMLQLRSNKLLAMNKALSGASNKSSFDLMSFIDKTTNVDKNGNTKINQEFIEKLNAKIRPDTNYTELSNDYMYRDLSTDNHPHFKINTEEDFLKYADMESIKAYNESVGSLRNQNSNFRANIESVKFISDLHKKVNDAVVAVQKRNNYEQIAYDALTPDVIARVSRESKTSEEMEKKLQEVVEQHRKEYQERLSNDIRGKTKKLEDINKEIEIVQKNIEILKKTLNQENDK